MILIQLLILAGSGVAVLSQTCPFDHFSAVFTATFDANVNSLFIFIDDPELTYFKTIMQFREADIQHTTDDAIQFFKDSYGLDFSESTPNPQNQRVFQNATMGPFILPPDKFNYIVTDNNWIRSGNTRSNCYLVRYGGLRVLFSGEQTLYGSYGGVEGKTVERGSIVSYGFFNIDVCKQSPIIIQFQTTVPFRPENIDGSTVVRLDYNLYNHVLGHGESQGTLRVTPDPNKDGQYHVSLRSILLF